MARLSPELIRNIRVNDSSSWKNKVFLTFDFDWACNEVIMHTVTILEQYRIKATFFCTHKTSLLNRLIGNPLFDVGIHPDFNFLLEKRHYQNKSVQSVVKDLLKMVPNSTVVRSHSLLQSTRLSDLFAVYKLRFECNTYIPYSSGIDLKPYTVSNIVKVPHCWEDDLFLCGDSKWDIDDILNSKGIKVFDFHPIHIYLNTEKIERYERIKNRQHDIESLSRNIHAGKKLKGTKDYLLELIKPLL